MGLTTEQRQDVTYFTGTEVEMTPAHGLYTLFVVGTPPTSDILYKAMRHKVSNIYFGTSQSFNPETEADWKEWDRVIMDCLNAKENYFVTLDFDVKHSEYVLDSGWNEHHNFISMISVKLPYLSQFNYNSSLKIDDTTWGHSNPGVWTHRLHELLQVDKFTHWKEYTGDEGLRAEENTDEKFLTLT